MLYLELHGSHAQSCLRPALISFLCVLEETVAVIVETLFSLFLYSDQEPVGERSTHRKIQQARRHTNFSHMINKSNRAARFGHCSIHFIGIKRLFSIGPRMGFPSCEASIAAIASATQTVRSEIPEDAIAATGPMPKRNESTRWPYKQGAQTEHAFDHIADRVDKKQASTVTRKSDVCHQGA